MKVLDGTLGRYTLGKELGHGGNGTVYRAQGPTGEVAIKRLHRSSASSDRQPRFFREVLALEKLSGIDGVLPVLDRPAQSTDLKWFAMPVAVLLRDRLGEDPAIEQVCGALSQIASVLSRVHAIGVEHRDIKPDNLYWYRGKWAIGDFGLANFPEAESITAEGAKVGPMHYIAPEMLNAASSSDGKKADIYSLGKTLWVLATGQKYPLPGTHDPSYGPTSVATFRPGKMAVFLDELICNMTKMNPNERPVADSVSFELAELCKPDGASYQGVSTPDFRQLRALLSKGLTAEQESKRREEAAIRSGGRIANVCWNEIGMEIRDATGLDPTEVHEVPLNWGFRQSLGSPRVVSEWEGGAAFEPFSETWNYRLSIGWKCQLLSSNEVVLHVGYFVNRLLYGEVSDTSGVPTPWNELRKVANGMPSSDSAVQELVDGLRRELPAVIEAYSSLLASLSN